MPALTLSQARQIIDAALEAAQAAGFRPMAVVVVDAAAQVLASARDDGASALRLDIALGKAAAAVGMGANSRVLAQRARELPVFFNAVAVAAQQRFIAQTGAVLVLDAAGAVIGGVGASGGSGDEDEQIVIAGVQAAGLRHA